MVKSALVGLAAVAFATWQFCGGRLPDLTQTTSTERYVAAATCDQQLPGSLRELVEGMPLNATLHIKVVDVGPITTFQNQYGDTVCKTVVLTSSDQEYTLVFHVIKRNGKDFLEGRLT